MFEKARILIITISRRQRVEQFRITNNFVEDRGRDMASEASKSVEEVCNFVISETFSQLRQVVGLFVSLYFLFSSQYVFDHIY